MVKKFLALAAVLFLGCASVFASGDIEIGLLDEEMDYEEFYETFSDVDNASDYFDCDLEECDDDSIITELFEAMTENVSGLTDDTVVVVADDDVIFVFHWGSHDSYAYFVD